jgi:hypothetical protein
MSCFIYLATHADSNTMLFVTGYIFGLGMGFGFPAHLAMAGDLAPMALRAKSTSLVLSFLDLSWFLLPLYSGAAIPILGERGAFQSLALFGLLAGTLITWMWIAYNRRIEGGIR